MRTANGIRMELRSDNKSGTIIGRRGETLDSIQYLASILVNKDSEDYCRLLLDSNGYREKRRKTLEQLAEKMNVSTPYIAKIENGKQTGPIELAVEFAEFFAVSLDYLLVGKGDFAEEQKRGLRMAISLLSELEASL